MKQRFMGKVWLKRAVLVGAGMALVVTVLSLGPVDYSPYLGEEYYAKTVAELSSPNSASSAASVITGELQAGFGRALLNPISGTGDSNKFARVPLAGFGARKGKPATGVHDDVYVKAVALKVNDRLGVMVGADALIIPRQVADRAMLQLKDLGLTREQVYFGATHTHSSLGGWGEGLVAESFAGPYNPALSEWFSEKLVTAVREALNDLKPAELGKGEFAAGEFVRNRLVGKQGTIDPEFSFQVIRQTTTQRLGIIGSYSAHATVVSARNMEFSGDYPGYWARALEQEGGFAMFLSGGVGSHSPNPGAGAFEGAERMGNRLAQLVKERLPLVALTNVVSLGIRGLDVALPTLHARLTDGVRLRPWLAKQLLPVSDRTFIQGFRLNDTIWISTPCDFSGELALGIKDFAQARGFQCVVTSFNGDYIGYVIPARYYHLGGYEPRLMSFYGPNTADYFDELIRRVAASLWN